jgi:AraC-like DNA-binding protein
VELERGTPPIEVAQQLGYADQAHLTRSLQRFMGRTPGEIQRSRLP